jgi:EmrB/QacA subfamily drug resistance transporter
VVTNRNAEPDPRRWKALWICLTAGFMTLLDVSIVNVALPSIQHGIGATATDVSWVVSGYALTFGLALVPSGRLGDDYGRKRMFLIGLLLFVATSAVCGAARGAEWLVIARLCQGAAGGVLNPQVIGMIQQLFSGRERGRAFGLFGASVGLSTAVGPLLGGVLIQVFGETDGWRYVFYVNLPIGLLALLFGARLLPGGNGSGRRQRPDLLGTVLLGLAVASVMLPLIEDEERTSRPHWWLTGVGAVLLVLFVVWEKWLGSRGRHPLVKLELLRVPSYAMGALLGTVYFAGFTGIFLIATLFFQRGLGYSALAAGASTLAFAVGSAISPAIGGRVVLRFGRPMVVLGMAAAAVGLAGSAVLMWRWTGAGTAFVLAGPLFVAGFGTGLVIAPNQTLSLEEIPPAEGGTAAGVFQTGQRVGTAIGTALGGSLFFGDLSRSHGDYHRAAAVGFAGSVALVLVALIIGLLDVALSARRRRRAEAVPLGRHSQPEPTPRVPAAPPPTTPSVLGTVSDLSGAAVRAAVTLTSLTGQQVARARADDGGRFALTTEAGRYLLLVTAPRLQPEVREIDLNGSPVTADITLTGTAELSGTVSAARGPVPGARVSLIDHDGDLRHVAVTDGDGRYLVAGIQPGEYTVVATGYGPTTSTVYVPAGGATRQDVILQQDDAAR